jgi:hypothetical protein
MEDESSDAALLEQEDQSIILVELDKSHTNNPAIVGEHVTTNVNNKSSVVVNLSPKSTQPVTSLQRNPNCISSSSNLSNNNNNNKNSAKNRDTVNVVKNHKKHNLNFFKFSTSSGNINSNSRYLRRRFAILTISFFVLGIAIGALVIYFTINKCNGDETGKRDTEYIFQLS